MITATATSVTDQQKPDIFRTISLTALLTGTLNIIAAIIKFYIDTNDAASLKLTSREPGPVSFLTYVIHGGPAHVFKYIASAVFGSRPTIGEELLITWGIVFHFMIAFLFTAFLFIIYPNVIRLLRNKYITAILYGVFTWAVMNLVVLPLSSVPEIPFDPQQAGISVLVLTCLIGLPVSLAAHTHYRKRRIA